MTPFNGDQLSTGILFDITTYDNDIRITNISINCCCEMKAVQIYRPYWGNSYKEFDYNNEFRWVFEFERNINCNGFGKITNIGGVNMFFPRNTTQAMLIFIPNTFKNYHL